MKRKIMYIFPLLVLFFCTAIYAHDNIIIHPAITEIAVGKSNIDQYLKDNLNLKDGLKTTLQPVGNQTVLYLLSKGSIDEDALDTCRASNHFLNPLKTWDKAGMSDEPCQTVEKRPYPKGHHGLLGFPPPSSLRHTQGYASLFMISETSHLSIFEQSEYIIYKKEEETT